MNKEELLKLADVIIGGRFTDTGVAMYDATSEELLAFANACEKIGMENALTRLRNVFEEYESDELFISTVLDHIDIELGAHKE